MAKRNEDRYGRGGYGRDRDRAHDRGYVDRATDEVRSWFGDDDAERRRHMDEQRDRASGHYRDENRSGSRSDWNRSQPSRMSGGNWGPNEWQRARDFSSDRSRWDRPGSSSRHGESSSYGQAYRDRDYDTRTSDWQWSDRNRDLSDRNPYGEWSERDVAPTEPDSREWSLRDRQWDSDPYQRYQSHDWRHSPSNRDRSFSDARSSSGSAFWGRGPKGYQRGDSRIQEDVCDRLTYSDVNAENIEVTVSSGEVTLTGVVYERWDKRRAEDLAEDVAGVREVHNNIRVQRDDRFRDQFRDTRDNREDRGIGMSDTSTSSQPGTVLGVNPTSGSHLTSTPSSAPKGRT